MLRIRDVNPGLGSKFSHPGSASKNFNPALGNVTRVVRPGSGYWFFTRHGSRVQRSKWHQIPDQDPQHWKISLNFNIYLIKFFSYVMKEALSETSDRWRSNSRLCSFSIGSLNHRRAFKKADTDHLFSAVIQYGGKATVRVESHASYDLCSGSRIHMFLGLPDPDPSIIKQK